MFGRSGPILINSYHFFRVTATHVGGLTMVMAIISWVARLLLKNLTNPGDSKSGEHVFFISYAKPLGWWVRVPLFFLAFWVDILQWIDMWKPTIYSWFSLKHDLVGGNSFKWQWTVSLQQGSSGTKGSASSQNRRTLSNELLSTRDW